MEMILFVGIPATGKSRYYKEKFYHTHIRINLDMLKTRHREKLLMAACFEAKQSFVVDNTNLTTELRKAYIENAKKHGFTVKGYYFRSSVVSALVFNQQRENKVPEAAILSAHAKLELPKATEGFAELFFVRHDDGGDLVTEEYQDEV